MGEAMLGVVPWLAMDAVAWLIVAAFLAGGLLEGRDERLARRLSAAAWVGFAGFWLVLAPHFVLAKFSYIEGVLAVAAVPACLLAARRLLGGADRLLVLSRAVAAMGLVYLPFVASQPLNAAGIELTTRQVEWVINVLGRDPAVIGCDPNAPAAQCSGDYPVRNTFVFYDPSIDHRYTMTVLAACTGMGSISILVGLIAAADAPFRRKALAGVLVVPVVYVLNVIRLTFITLALGEQWFAGVHTGLVTQVFGVTDPRKASFLIADKVIAQSLTVIVLVLLVLGILRVLPEVVESVEAALFAVTGTDYDLAGALDLDPDAA
jgi:archaeosortase A (PGF-CTERM-specific)